MHESGGTWARKCLISTLLSISTGLGGFCFSKGEKMVAETCSSTYLGHARVRSHLGLRNTAHSLLRRCGHVWRRLWPSTSYETGALPFVGRGSVPGSLLPLGRLSSQEPGRAGWAGWAERGMSPVSTDNTGLEHKGGWCRAKEEVGSMCFGSIRVE